MYVCAQKLINWWVWVQFVRSKLKCEGSSMCSLSNMCIFFYVDVEYFNGGCVLPNNSYTLLPIYLVIYNFI